MNSQRAFFIYLPLWIEQTSPANCTEGTKFQPKCTDRCWTHCLWVQSAQSWKWGRWLWKKPLCPCCRSDYLPSFHHQFNENNHGFVFYSHARLLRPQNAGENQNQTQRERERVKLVVQVPLSCIPPLQILTTGLSTLFSSNSSCHFLSLLFYIHGLLPSPTVFLLCHQRYHKARIVPDTTLFEQHQYCSVRLSPCSPLNSISHCIIKRQQFTVRQLELDKCDALNEVPGGKTSPGITSDAAPQYRDVQTHPLDSTRQIH